MLQNLSTILVQIVNSPIEYPAKSSVIMICKYKSKNYEKLNEIRVNFV